MSLMVGSLMVGSLMVGNAGYRDGYPMSTLAATLPRCHTGCHAATLPHWLPRCPRYSAVGRLGLRGELSIWVGPRCGSCREGGDLDEVVGEYAVSATGSG